jgi:hypothetical protein
MAFAEYDIHARKASNFLAVKHRVQARKQAGATPAAVLHEKG